MVTAVASRLQALQELLGQQGVDAYVVPSADEHLNEYVPEAKQRRAWVSGFTGSAGDLLVTRTGAYLFVDGRYFEQADREVDPRQIQIHKLGQPEHKSLIEQIQALAQGCPYRVAFDPFTVDVATYREWQKQVPLVEWLPVTGNWVDAIRGEVPACDTAPVYKVPALWTGGSVADKLTQVREQMRQRGATLLPVTKLDQIAWLLNLRGADIAYNPVFIAYGVVGLEQAWLFTNLERVPQEIQAELRPYVQLHPYQDYERVWAALAAGSRIWLAPHQTTVGTWQVAAAANPVWVEGLHPIEGLKSRKSRAELAGMEVANLKASRAKTRLIHWLLQQVQAGYTLTEAGVAAQLEQFYRQEEGFLGLSFNTIAGAGANSSIVHYGTPDPHRPLGRGELLLLDSGCQFWGGTTDDTRTLILGDADGVQRERYTRVLQAHINCARQVFPQGTAGHHLDGITRWQLWQVGLDYNHGTGHGVGAFLNVHEGPNGIHKKASHPLEPGMITSIEPGYYEPGWGGIRIENLYQVVEVPRQDCPSHLPQSWCGFTSLTYIPLDPRLIVWELLTPEQAQWVKDYHAQVYQRLGPTLPGDVAAWLEDYLG
ncbi:MAG: aminopeptidase P family protein [Thermostichales cyanobacterium SZTDM-1c_bins_54]